MCREFIRTEAEQTAKDTQDPKSSWEFCDVQAFPRSTGSRRDLGRTRNCTHSRNNKTRQADFSALKRQLAYSWVARMVGGRVFFVPWPGAASRQQHPHGHMPSPNLGCAQHLRVDARRASRHRASSAVTSCTRNRTQKNRKHAPALNFASLNFGTRRNCREVLGCTRYVFGLRGFLALKLHEECVLGASGAAAYRLGGGARITLVAVAC